jgi:hypothetical protein
MKNILVRVVSAEYVKGYQLRLRFSDGEEKVVDFSRWIRGEMFKLLANKRQFKGFLLPAAPFVGRTVQTSLQKPCEITTKRRVRPNSKQKPRIY